MYILFPLNLLALGLSLALLILEVIWKYTGFEGQPIVITACSEAYFTAKFGNLSLDHKILLFATSISLILELIMFLMVLAMMIPKNKNS